MRHPHAPLCLHAQSEERQAELLDTFPGHMVKPVLELAHHWDGGGLNPLLDHV